MIVNYDINTGQKTIEEDVYADMLETWIKTDPKLSSTTLVLSLMSDTHYDKDNQNATKKITSMLQLGMMENYMPVDAIGNLGDMINGNEAKSASLTDLLTLKSSMSQNTKKPILFARGNHDDNGYYSQGGFGGSYQSDEMFNDVEWFENMFATTANDVETDVSNPYGGYGYYDHSPSKVRIILLNTSDIPYVETDGAYKYSSFNGHAFSDSQIKFVANALEFSDKDAPNDWAVLFLSHVPLDTATANGYRFGIADALIRGVEVMLAVIQAYKNGSSFSFVGSVYNASLGDTSADFTVSVSADYSTKGAGDVVGFISGHTHSDNYSKAVGYEMSLSRGYSFLGLIGATSFTNFVIDRTNSKISVVKHGTSAPETATGTVVGVPDEGSIASGEWSVLSNQFRPDGSDLFNSWDSMGDGYTFHASAGISLATMEVTDRVESANWTLTKAIAVKPFTKYMIPDDYVGAITAYGSTGARSGALTPVDEGDYKVVTTGIRQYYLVFAFHRPTYTDYLNFKTKELYYGLTF